jgi:hypothetical protein
VIAGLALAPPAQAKMCVKLTTLPAQPSAGARATIRATTWLGLVEPLPAPLSFRVTVLAVAPNRDFWMIELRRHATEASVLERAFVFGMPGVWKLTWAGFPGRESSPCAGTIRVRVRAR